MPKGKTFDDLTFAEQRFWAAMIGAEHARKGVYYDVGEYLCAQEGESNQATRDALRALEEYSARIGSDEMRELLDAGKEIPRQWPLSPPASRRLRTGAETPVRQAQGLREVDRMVNREFSAYRPENRWKRTRMSEAERIAFWQGFLSAIVLALIVVIGGLAIFSL